MLGLRPQDVAPKKKDEFDSEVSFEIFERKRRMLMDNARNLAADTPEAAAGTGGAGAAAAERNAAFMQSVLDIEQRIWRRWLSWRRKISKR